MKVLKDGNVPEVWSTEVTCAKDDRYDQEKPCGAVLEVGEKDLLLRYWRGTHFTHHYAAVRCPRCGKYIRVKNIPTPVYNRVYTAKKRSATFDGFSESIY